MPRLLLTAAAATFMGDALHRWEQWWFRSGPPHALACLRIGFGIWLLLYFAPLAPHVPVLFSSEGLALPLGIPNLPRFLLPLVAVPSEEVAWLLFFLLLFSLLLFTLGCCMRVSGIVALLVLLELYVTSQHLTWFTFEHLSSFLLLILTLSGADRTLSVRMLWKRGSLVAWEPVCLLPQRLIACQITATFLGAGWQKLFLPDWQSGEILTFSLVGRWATPLAFSIARLNLPIEFYDAVTYLVMMFEFFLPIGLWIESQRVWWVLGMFLFLLGITSLFGFFWFLILAPASIAFVAPGDVYKFLKLFIRYVNFNLLQSPMVLQRVRPHANR